MPADFEILMRGKAFTCFFSRSNYTSIRCINGANKDACRNVSSFMGAAAMPLSVLSKHLEAQIKVSGEIGHCHAGTTQDSINNRNIPDMNLLTRFCAKLIRYVTKRHKDIVSYIDKYVCSSSTYLHQVKLLKQLVFLSRKNSDSRARSRSA